MTGGVTYRILGIDLCKLQWDYRSVGKVDIK